MGGPNFNIESFLKQLSVTQLTDNVNRLFIQELRPDGEIPIKEYLQAVHQGQITEEMRSAAVQQILQFGYQFQCMDQTVMQAIYLGDVYLSRNPAVSPAMVSVVYTVGLEIAIKINEDMLLAFTDLVLLFEDKFQLSLFLQLEKHIMQINKLRLDPPTALDFVMHFMFIDQEFWTGFQPVIRPYQMANQCLPVIYLALIEYQPSRLKRSVIAVAAMCYILQESESAARSSGVILNIQPKRDQWLRKVKARFPQLDLESSYQLADLIWRRKFEGQQQNVNRIWPFPAPTPTEQQQETISKFSRLSIEQVEGQVNQPCQKIYKAAELNPEQKSPFDFPEDENQIMQKEQSPNPFNNSQEPTKQLQLERQSRSEQQFEQELPLIHPQQQQQQRMPLAKYNSYDDEPISLGALGNKQASRNHPQIIQEPLDQDAQTIEENDSSDGEEFNEKSIHSDKSLKSIKERVRKQQKQGIQKEKKIKPSKIKQQIQTSQKNKEDESGDL